MAALLHSYAAIMTSNVFRGMWRTMTRDELYPEASRIVKAELVRRDVSYKDLARLLGDESYLQLKTKINRGSFSAGFFIKVMRAIGADHVDLSRREAPRK
jgi:hypothetical protein